MRTSKRHWQLRTTTVFWCVKTLLLEAKRGVDFLLPALEGSLKIILLDFLNAKATIFPSPWLTVLWSLDTNCAMACCCYCESTLLYVSPLLCVSQRYSSVKNELLLNCDLWCMPIVYCNVWIVLYIAVHPQHEYYLYMRIVAMPILLLWMIFWIFWWLTLKFENWFDASM